MTERRTCSFRLLLVHEVGFLDEDVEGVHTAAVAAWHRLRTQPQLKDLGPVLDVGPCIQT